MTLRALALAALTTLALVPAASAQGIWHHGPGHIYSPETPSIGHYGPGSGGAGPIGAPVQAQDCGAAHAQILVGRNIHNTPLPGGVRVIGPDTIVTFDYRTDRLNVAHDGYGTITRVYCG